MMINTNETNTSDVTIEDCVEVCGNDIQEPSADIIGDIERYFATLKKEEHIPAEEVYGRKILEKAESKYFEHLNIYEEKQKEIRDLKDNISKVETTLRQCKNIKNVKKAGLNKERSIKRKKLRAQLAKLKMDLTELEGVKEAEP